jgi:hypothetical protein
MAKLANLPSFDLNLRKFRIKAVIRRHNNIPPPPP